MSLVVFISLLLLASRTAAAASHETTPLRGRALAQGCCSIDFMNCDGTFCGSTKEACESCDQDVDTAWLENGPLTDGSCLKKWADCTNDPDACCFPGLCMEVNDNYSQCQPVEWPSTSPSEAPSDAPSMEPSAAPRNGCCSLNFKNFNRTKLV
mmetsp:Transcript_770/g.1027  ORF Transcript_770/g.1027 Transcript_770/m.1027 type:complete len:153 (-) Transcript_770:103-561(-)